MGLVTKSSTNQGGVTVLFDGDILVYRAGFASEKRVYTLDYTLWKGLEWNSAKEVKAYVAKDPRLDPSMIRQGRKLEPVENAYSNVDRMILSTCDKLAKRYKVAPSEVEVYVFLTGCDIKPNFREEVAHTYKMNRNPAHKPTYINEIREYISKKYPTVLTQGAETDDYLCQASLDTLEANPEGHKAIIASIDKDLLCVPGTHYNFVDDVLKQVTEAEANYNFFMQTLIGDTADNIKGIKGVGHMKASKLLSPYATQEEKMFAVCLLQYQHQHGENFVEEWNKNAILLWIWRTIPGWCPFLVSGEDDAKEIIHNAMNI